jgi:hypothetical protein
MKKIRKSDFLTDFNAQVFDFITHGDYTRTRGKRYIIFTFFHLAYSNLLKKRRISSAIFFAIHSTLTVESTAIYESCMVLCQLPAGKTVLRDH